LAYKHGHVFEESLSMRKFILLWWGLVLVAAAQGAERTFVLATAGEVDAGLAARVRDYLQDNTWAAVRLADPVAIQPGESLEATGRAAARTLGENDHSLIVLARPDTAQPQGICLPHDRFAILNIARLEAVEPADKLERRAGQDGLRVMAMLLGLSQCPFPLCVLVGYDQTADLDEMSGNYCPPCKDRFLRLARAAGLRLVEPEPPAGEAAAAAADE
jgi:hypothetical protein